MEAIWLALIVALGALLTAGLNAWVVRLGKKQDYARQDAVADQAAEAARLLLEANERVAAQTADALRITEGKLNQIHELVNSNMTASITDQLLANEQLLVALKLLAGSNNDPVAAGTIVATQDKIGELRSRLSDRATATRIANALAPKIES